MEQPLSQKMSTVLRRKRLECEYSQKYVAEMISVKRVTITNLENNKLRITLDLLDRLAGLYQVTVSSLIQEAEVCK